MLSVQVTFWILRYSGLFRSTDFHTRLSFTFAQHIFDRDEEEYEKSDDRIDGVTPMKRGMGNR